MCSKRTYENALTLLKTRRRNGRPTHVTDATPTLPSTTNIFTGARSSYRGAPSITGMRDWLGKIGYTDVDVAALNIIHVAGTKGKGSTCAFARSLLQARGQRTGFPNKIGLYTSPDLTCIRERIQIDGQPISEDLFTKYFFEIWDRLFLQPDRVTTDDAKQPRFLQFMALLAIHTFTREGTRATIFETHHGGEYDATNVIAAPVVTGITSIGLDHLAQLGPEIEDVAWHKAGIFKTGTPAFSSPQTPAVEAVLRARASQKNVEFAIVSVDPSLPRHANALRPHVQRINCSLAIALVNTFLSAKSPIDKSRLSEQDIETGIENFSWPGRFEIIKTPRCTWFLDGAHNELSIGQAVEWFAEMTSSSLDRDGGPKEPRRLVIFSHISEERDGLSLLRALGTALERNAIRSAEMVFTTYQECRDGEVRFDKTLKAPDPSLADLPKQYPALWESIQPAASSIYVPSIEEALEYADEASHKHGNLQVLVTGSLHLVGGALYLLQRQKADTTDG
ncbi:folylpolyglutamate synthase [Cladophialophora yegresii CBS 114405]|uniref:Folylpolyglutamate synthase n=1 Tax=Cladophialophora yegresii CBS 114405 TaxID=1182544 RepID=W9WBN2_9EURO|nr:folylpolyglutamate synthase [Cladophialophora yegresii CBS 114405]EXJ65532.1 folylpolyglutamate synthase [Cladophialophora yegresii CBS 114405]